MRRESRIELPDLDGIADQRMDVRYGLSGLVPASLRGADHRDLDVVLLDVSRGGLGLLASGFPHHVGDVLMLCIEGQASIPLVVRWTRRSRLGDRVGLPGMTRVGLAVQWAQENLLSRLEPFDCIDQ
jgi:hypothetical protein